MLYLSLIVLCFNTILCSLTAPVEKFTLKKCVQNIIKNYIDVDTTVLYMYNNNSDDILPEDIQNPIITMNSRNIVIPKTYKRYKLLTILNTREMNLKTIKVDLKSLRPLWNEKSLVRRHYLIIWPLKKIDQIKNVFFYFWKKHVLDVIIMVYDFNFKNNSIMVVTSDPHHNLNLCGTALHYVEQQTCQRIKPVRRSRTFNKLNFCNVTYIVKSNTLNWEKYSSEQTFVSRFVVETIAEALNLTLILKRQNKIDFDGEELEFRTSEQRNCLWKYLNGLYHEETYEKYSVFFTMSFYQYLIQYSKIKMNILMNDPILPDQPSALATKSDVSEKSTPLGCPKEESRGLRSRLLGGDPLQLLLLRYATEYLIR
ncbi:hypothetical protein FQA39_LY16875 [Lamprigera yunnana]|nr:hypothetical protein FQA39_LY16875 [Lamprigera yunnana]